MGFIGLAGAKVHIDEMYNNVWFYELKMAQRSTPVGSSDSLHLTLTGAPGTTKTSIDRLLCKMYFGLGLLNSPEFIEVSKADLVGQHIGDTEAKTKAILDRARGRALFIDESPELYIEDNERDFGRIALDVINKLVEDHRHDTMIALAGYARPMSKMFNANLGMRGRFPTTLEFTSNTADEIVAIAEKFAASERVDVAPEALDHLAKVATWLCSTPAPHDPSMPTIDVANNGRFARNVIGQAVRKAKVRQASDTSIDLLTISDEELARMRTITVDAITAAVRGVLDAGGIGPMS
jgi:SpoVK/Ycf46/Vps4 family AAA+-type ATPase